jgi:hypothetical protein
MGAGSTIDHAVQRKSVQEYQHYADAIKQEMTRFMAEMHDQSMRYQGRQKQALMGVVMPELQKAIDECTVCMRDVSDTIGVITSSMHGGDADVADEFRRVGQSVDQGGAAPAGTASQSAIQSRLTGF